MPEVAEMSLEQCGMALVVLERQCSHCTWQEGYFVEHGTGEICRFCHGTSQVPRYPMLRETCQWCSGDGKKRVPKLGGMSLAGAWYETSPTKEPDPNCQGRGFVPVSGDAAAVALLEALWSVGLMVSTWTQQAIELSNVEETMIWAAPGHGAEALARALLAARSQEAKA